MNPWDLSPDIWKCDISCVNNAQVDHVMSGRLCHACLEDTCEVPCPCDRWCTERVLPCNVADEPRDPIDLERLLHSGPQRISHKQVRFNDHPEIIVIDEGFHDDGQIQDDAVEKKVVNEISPGEETFSLAANPFCVLHESTQVDHFWDEFHWMWTQVAKWFPVDQQDADNNAFQKIDHEDSSEDVGEEYDDSNIRVSFSDWEAFVPYVGSSLSLSHDTSVITYGLRHIDLGRRDVIVWSLEPRKLRQQMWSLWQDSVGQLEHLVIHPVWPQPGPQLNEPDAIVFLIEIVTDHSVLQACPVLRLTTDHAGEILEGPVADYVEWPGKVDNLLQAFRHYEWCRPEGFREYQLSCGSHHVHSQCDSIDEYVINKGSFCLFVLGELPLPFQQASAWFDNYERLARIALTEHTHGRGDFVMKILGVETGCRNMVFPFRDILHPQDLLLQMVGDRPSRDTELRFSLLPHTDLPIDQEDHSRTIYVLEYDSHALPDLTCVFVTQICHQLSSTCCGTVVLRIPKHFSLADFHHALCIHHGLDPCRDFSFLAGSTPVVDAADLADRMVFQHFISDQPSAPLSTTGSSFSIGDIPAEARLMEQLQLLADDAEANEGEDSPADEDTPVSFHNWNDLVTNFDVNAEIPTDGVRIITFGLRGVAQGRRDIHAQSMHPTHLRRLLWELWQDVAARFEDLEVYFVLPQPWEELQAPGAVILLVEIFADTLSPNAPVLSLTWDETVQTLLVEPHAMFLPSRATRIEMLQRLPFGELCLPIGPRDCLLSCGLRQVLDEVAANLVPIGRGYLCKLRLPGKSEEVILAERWFRNFERFAMTLLAELPDGKPHLTVCVHHLDGSSSAVSVECINAHQPDAIVSALHAVSGRPHAVYRSVDNMDVYVAHVRQGYDCHVMEIDISRDDSITVLVVTITKDVDKTSHTLGTQVHSWVEGHAPWPEVLHMRLCADYEISADRPFMFYLGGQRMSGLDTIALGQVIVHYVSASHGHEDNDESPPAGDTEANVDLRSASQVVGPPLPLEPQESQSMSLLQKQVRRFKQATPIWTLQYSRPAIFDKKPVVDDFVRQHRVVLQFPEWFDEPMAWYDIQLGIHLESYAELVTPLVKDFTVCDIVVELGQQVQPFVLRTPRNTSVRGLCDTLGLANGGTLLHNGIAKPNHESLCLVDADVCSFQDAQQDIQFPVPPHLELAFFHPPSQASNLLTTCWISNIPEAPFSRVDVVTSLDSNMHMRKVHDVIDAMLSFPVTCVPSHLDPNTDIRLLTSDSVCPAKVSVLTLCDFGHVQKWQHARVKATLDISVIDTLTTGHCWQRVDCNGIPLTRYDLANGTVHLHHGDVIRCWLHLDTSQKQVAQPTLRLRSSLEDGEAPCPCDRWCANLDSIDFDADHVRTWMDELPHSWTTPHSGTSPNQQASFSPEPVCVSEDTSDHQKVTISLDSTIPIAHCKQGPGVHLWDCPAWIDQLWTPWTTQLCPLPDGITVHPNTAKALAHVLPLELMQLERFFIFVDGSGSQGSGWAIALVSEGQLADGSKGVHFHGSLWGQLSIDPAHHAWLGAKVGDSIDAEIAAANIAMLFAIAHHSLFGDKPVFLCPDLQYSQGLVEGKFTPHLHRPSTAVLARLGSIASHRQIQVLHARAHRGWEWNELEDVLAKHAVDSDAPWSPSEATIIGEMIRANSASPWMDWHPSVLEPAMQATIPPTDDHCSFDVAIPSTRGELVMESVQHDMRGTEDVVHLKVMTFNILSIRPDESQDQFIGRQFDTKTDRVDHQACQLGVDILCLQEARTPAGQHRSRHYDIYASGAERCGRSLHYGCEIWLKKGSGFSASQTQVVHTDERLLMIRAIKDHTPWLIVSGHAPSIGAKSDSAAVHKWWNRFHGLLRKYHHDDWIILGIDANACLASEASDHFSMFDASEGGPTGDMFEKFIQDSHLFVPSTFSSIHQGDSWTWRHPKGKRKRLDFLLTSMSLRTWCVRTHVCQNFDSGYAHEDHLPLILELAGTSFVSEHESKLDEGKMLDPDRCAAFQQALWTLPIPHWNVDVDQHAELMRIQLRQLATQFFGKTHAPRQAPWMSEGTASLVHFKRQVLQVLRHTESDDEQHAIKHELRCLEKMVASSCAQDKRKFFADIATALQTSGEAGNFKQVYARLGQLSSKRKRKEGNVPRPLPQIEAEPDQPVTSFAERQAVFFRQFAEIESANIVAIEDIAQEACKERPLTVSQVDTNFIPSLAQISRKLQKLKRGKAPGPDQIVPALLKAGGPLMARHLASLFAKVALWSSEPLQWKTGILVALFKKGNHRDPSNYRSIYISDHIAKLYHSCVRDHLGALYDTQALDTQMGGRTGKGTDMAHHILQSFQVATQQANVSSAVFFLDLHSAFYAVIRQFLFDTEWNDQALCALLHRLKISPDEIHNIKQRCSAEDATQHMHPHGVSILKDIFDGANFQMRGVRQIGIPTRGTRPGDPVGDVCFNLLMCSMLREYRRHMKDRCHWLPDAIPVGDAGWKTGFVFPPGATFYDVSFVDDVSVMVAHTDGHELVSTAKMIAQCWCQTAERRGLLVNFKPEKTELMLTFRGKGSRSLKQQHFVFSDPEVALNDLATPHKLQLVHSYKHVGTQIQADGRPRKDIQYRIAKAKQAWGPLHKPFFAKREIAVETKVQIFQSLVLSRFAYQVHVWTGASDDMLDKWHNALRPMVIPLAKQQVGSFALETLDVTTLCGLIKLPSPKDLLTKNRLLYVKRALVHGPHALWSLLAGVDSSKGWQVRLVSDLQWLRDFLHLLDGVPPCEDWKSWLDYIIEHPNWPTMVRRAFKACLRFRHNQASGKLWERRMEMSFKAEGVRGPVSGAQTDEQPQLHCGLCSCTFASKRALAMHAHQIHGYLPLAKLFAFGTECWACRKRYHCRPRLIHHLMYSQGCVARLRAVFPPLSQEQAIQLDHDDLHEEKSNKHHGWTRYKALLPVVKIPMPSLPDQNTPDAHKMNVSWELRYGPGSDAYLQLEGYRVNAATGPTAPEPFDDYPMIIMQSYGGTEVGHGGRFQYNGISVWDFRLHLRSVCFVHFYSGYRRDRDLCHCIENEFMWGQTQVFCLSVDLCLQPEEGDLTHRRNQRWWLDRVATHQIFGGGGGSPCETYSAARFMPDGPPPLRSSSDPYGLPHLNRRQAMQVQVGNELVFFLTHFLRTVAACGGCGFSEHPQFPTWLQSKHPPSIWRLSPMRFFKRLQCASFISFDQCVVGATSVKPTTLLLIRMGQTRTYIKERGTAGRCCHGCGAHKALTGKTGENFATARAKVYPFGLNMALAQGIFGFLSHNLGLDNIPSGPCPLQFLPFHPSDKLGDDFIQPDYHG